MATSVDLAEWLRRCSGTVRGLLFVACCSTLHYLFCRLATVSQKVKLLSTATISQYRLDMNEARSSCCLECSKLSFADIIVKAQVFCGRIGVLQ